jgi:hypothetical protein
MSDRKWKEVLIPCQPLVSFSVIKLVFKKLSHVCSLSGKTKFQALLTSLEQ